MIVTNFFRGFFDGVLYALIMWLVLTITGWPHFIGSHHLELLVWTATVYWMAKVNISFVPKSRRERS